MNKPIASREHFDIEEVLGVRKVSAPRWWERRSVRWAALVVVAALSMSALWSLRGSRTAIQYVTAPAARGNLAVIITATGSVQPTNQVDVSSELSGMMRRVLVDYNSVVKVGDVLAELDTDKLVATTDAARAKVNAAKANVVEAEATLQEKYRDYTRKRVLAGKQIASTFDLDTALAARDRAAAAVESAKASVNSAEADLTLAETNLAKAQIRSPINGVILVRKVDPGQTVASSLQAPVLFQIAEDLKQMELQVDVDEADVGPVREGQTAIFTVDAYPDRKFPAKVRELRFASEVVQSVVTYKAVLAIDNADLLLRPGMTATAEINVQQVDDALLVPNAALRYAPAGQANDDQRSLLQRLLPGPPPFRAASAPEEKGHKRTLYVLREGELAAVSVEIGATDGRKTQILSGDLKPGDQVIVDQKTAQS